MHEINYNLTAQFCEEMSSKYSDLANLNYKLDSLSIELKSKKENYNLLEQRFLSLQEENDLNKQLLNSKSIYCKEVEAELEMISENERLKELVVKKQNQIRINCLLDNLDSLCFNINTSVLVDHCDYIKDLEQNSAPFVFKEILEQLEFLIKWKESYDQREEDGQDEHLLEF